MGQLKEQEMFFDDEVDSESPDALNQRLYDDVYHYLSDNANTLEESDGLLWVEADQKDDELLEEILEVVPEELHFAVFCETHADQTFDITLSRGPDSMRINYDAPDAFDEQFGYLFATVKAAQLALPEMSLRWWVGLERTGDLEDGVRPLVVLTHAQWQGLIESFGAERINSEFAQV